MSGRRRDKFLRSIDFRSELQCSKISSRTIRKPPLYPTELRVRGIGALFLPGCETKGSAAPADTRGKRPSEPRRGAVRRISSSEFGQAAAALGGDSCARSPVNNPLQIINGRGIDPRPDQLLRLGTTCSPIHRSGIGRTDTSSTPRFGRKAGRFTGRWCCGSRASRERREERAGMLFWRMHRCARIVFSLGFHLGDMTAQECIDMLVDEVGHERDNAAAEVRRSFLGDYDPLYQLAYLIGGSEVHALEERDGRYGPNDAEGVPRRVPA